MFGYVRPYKPELKVKHLETYKSYYCGLCRHIKSDFGNISRLFLTYDLTFWAIFFDALSVNKSKYDDFFCVLHPLKKKFEIKNNNSLKYCSTLNMVFNYFKCKDDFVDDKNFLKLIMSKHIYKKIKKNGCINILDSISENFDLLNKLEKDKKFKTIDEICHPFSNIVGLIFKNYGSNFSNQIKSDLYDFGYSISKWIYIIDAFDDIDEDINTNKFNPLLIIYSSCKKEEIAVYVEELLITYNSKCFDLMNELPLYKNKDIIKNILEYGMMNKMHIVLKGE